MDFVDISTIIIVLMEIIILIVGLFIGYLIGKKISDSVKWEDKKKIIDSEWQLKIEGLDKNYQNQIADWKLKKETLDNNYQQQIAEWRLKTQESNNNHKLAVEELIKQNQSQIADWKLKMETQDKNYQQQIAEWKLKTQGKDSNLKLTVEEQDKKHQAELLKLKNSQNLEIKKIDEEWKLRYSTDLSEVKQLIQSAEKSMRNDAIKRSKRTILGKTWEQICPYFPEFPYYPSDMKFIGSPVDFIVFDGASENDIKQVVFLEVKSGNSKLNLQQRKLKQAIDGRNVLWDQYNVANPSESKTQLDEEEVDEETTSHEIYELIDEMISEIINNDNNAVEISEENDFVVDIDEDNSSDDDHAEGDVNPSDGYIFEESKVDEDYDIPIVKATTPSWAKYEDKADILSRERERRDL